MPAAAGDQVSFGKRWEGRISVSLVCLKSFAPMTRLSPQFPSSLTPHHHHHHNTNISTNLNTVPKTGKLLPQTYFPPPLFRPALNLDISPSLYPSNQSTTQLRHEYKVRQKVTGQSFEVDRPNASLSVPVDMSLLLYTCIWHKAQADKVFSSFLSLGDCVTTAISSGTCRYCQIPVQVPVEPHYITIIPLATFLAIKLPGVCGYSRLQRTTDTRIIDL